MKLLFATHNRNKIKEIAPMLPSGIQLSCLADFEGSQPTPETGATLEENALLKARAGFQQAGQPSFADDSGLFVSALGGQPGVHSARYAGAEADDLRNTEKLIRELQGQKDRSAWFETCIAFVDGHGEQLFHGRIFGDIALLPSGSQGFGYDPVFRPTGDARTFAQFSPQEKNAISHRGIAVRAFSHYLSQYIPKAL